MYYMKNHFYISYHGNKRNEVLDIYDNINFENIDTIIEPFCGSCAISYYIWLKNPNMKFILNDCNIHLKEMYEIYKDDNLIKIFEDEYSSLLVDINKEKYNKIIKEPTPLAWYIKNKIYTIKPGLFPLEFRKCWHSINLKSYPIYDFYKHANITFLNEDAIKVIQEYKDNNNCLFMIDPPYLNTCNSFYNLNNQTKVINNIYEYFINNNINNFISKVMLILQNNYTIKSIFKDNHFLKEYNKTYQMTHKKTTHLIITNYTN